MVKPRTLVKTLSRLFNREVSIEVKPPDLIVKNGSRICIVRYLIGDEVDYSVIESRSCESIKRFVESYASIIDKLPEGSEVKIVKLGVDLNSFINRLNNEMMNLKAILDVAEEPHVKQKALAKLKTLQSLYDVIIRGSGITRLNLVIKIRGIGDTVEGAKRMISSLSSIIENMVYSELGIKLRGASSSEIYRIMEYELGIIPQPSVKNIVVDIDRVASATPIPLHKKPAIEEGEGIPIGFDLETNWPVLIPLKMLNKHMIVLGPTGRGKTTFLASFIESLISMNVARVFAVDFKGDLAKLINDDLVRVVDPSKYPINLLEKPGFFNYIEWSLTISDVLVNVLNLDHDLVTRVLSRIHVLRNSKDLVEEILLDRDLSILAPVFELLSDKPRYGEFEELIEQDILFDLNGFGTAFQNVYGGLVINIYKKLVQQSSNDIHRVVVIDEAWRIARIRGVLELVKEGRSRNIGVVLASQNPSDLPREVIENAHLIMVFGSPNEDYRKDVKKMLGLSSELIKKLSYLRIGEAILLNALDPHPFFVRIKPPNKISTHSL